MAKNQKSYTSEFKQQFVELYNAGGTSYPQPERRKRTIVEIVTFIQEDEESKKVA